MKLLLVAFAMALFLPACRARNAVSPTESPAHAITGEWSLKSITGNPVNAMKPPWIRIEVGGGLRGWAGVNQISSQLDEPALARGEFKASPIIATRMAGPPEAMRLETDFLAALQSAKTFSAGVDTLDLRDSAGSSVAALSRKPMR
jgi:heat shock protein HslJ